MNADEQNDEQHSSTIITFFAAGPSDFHEISMLIGAAPDGGIWIQEVDRDQTSETWSMIRKPEAKRQSKELSCLWHSSGKFCYIWNLCQDGTIEYCVFNPKQYNDVDSQNWLHMASLPDSAMIVSFSTCAPVESVVDPGYLATLFALSNENEIWTTYRQNNEWAAWQKLLSNRVGSSRGAQLTAIWARNDLNQLFMVMENGMIMTTWRHSDNKEDTNKFVEWRVHQNEHESREFSNSQVVYFSVSSRYDEGGGDLQGANTNLFCVQIDGSLWGSWSDPSGWIAWLNISPPSVQSRAKTLHGLWRGDILTLWCLLEDGSLYSCFRQSSMINLTVDQFSKWDKVPTQSLMFITPSEYVASDDSKSSTEIAPGPLDSTSSKEIQKKDVTHTGICAVSDHGVVDHLEFELYAESLSNVLRQLTDEPYPVTVGVYASWGSGKSFLLKQIKHFLYPERSKQKKKEIKNQTLFQRLVAPFILLWTFVVEMVEKTCPFVTLLFNKKPPNRPKREYVFVQFNAWMYCECERLWPAMVASIFEVIEEEFGKYQSRWGLLRVKYEDKYYRMLYIPFVLIIFLLLIVLLLIAGASDDSVRSAFSGLDSALGATLAIGGTIGAICCSIGIENVYAMFRSRAEELQSASRLENSDFKSMMKSVKEDIITILKFCKLYNRRLVIFVDDLDRCASHQVVDVLRAVSLMLSLDENFDEYIESGDNQKNVDANESTNSTASAKATSPMVDIYGILLVLAIDPRFVISAVEASFKYTNSINQLNGYEFLEKIVQIPFCIPMIQEKQKRNLIQKICDTSKTAEEKNDGSKLLTIQSNNAFFARMLTAKPWRVKKLNSKKERSDFSATLSITEEVPATIDVTADVDNKIKYESHSDASKPYDEPQATTRPLSNQTANKNDVSIGIQDDQPHSESHINSNTAVQTQAHAPKSPSVQSSRLDTAQNKVPEESGFSAEEVETLKLFSPYMDGNPRRLKRIINVYNVARSLKRKSDKKESTPLPISDADLQRWIIMNEQWPFRCSWLIQLAEDEKQWRKLQHHEDLNETSLQDDLANQELVTEFFKRIFDPVKKRSHDKEFHEFHSLLALDSDPEVFSLILQIKFISRQMRVGDLSLLRLYSISLNPALQKTIGLLAYRLWSDNEKCFGEFSTPTGSSLIDRY